MPFTRPSGGKEGVTFHEICLGRVRRRIAGNPQEPLLERFVIYLIQRGYAPGTWYRCLRIADHFGRWLGQRSLTCKATRNFISRHLPVCDCPSRSLRDAQCNREALRLLLEMAGIAANPSPAATCFADRLLEQYGQHLARVRGLAPVTIGHRLDMARRLLHHFKVCRRSQISAWTAPQIQGYIARLVRPYQTSTGRAMASATRSFLRFLLHADLIQRDLAAAVPSLAHWRLAPLPLTLTMREIQQFLRSARHRTPLGLRDRAIVLCMIELGLRRPDVAGLRFDGVDLAHQVLRLQHHKERKAAEAPMTDRLAEAIKAYVHSGRPECASPFLFVQHRAPIDKPLSTSGIGHIVKRIARHAGLQNRIKGTHIFRHSLASRMLDAGAQLKQIADVLGHQSIDTTMIYAKVDLRALARVALPWPQSAQGNGLAKEVQS